MQGDSMNKRFAQTMMAALPSMALVVLWGTSARATPEIAEKVKKECTVCHVEEGSPDLNNTGKFYQKNKKLPPAAPKK
jgi:hypothetical protein